MDMNSFLSQAVYTAVSIVVLIILRTILANLVIKYARKMEKLEQRTKLILKYLDFTIVFLLILVNFMIWGIGFRDVGLVFSSVFAVIGIAFFAQWSILSNLTSGVIMFFTFPYKIGDQIKIHDKEFYTGILTIEDIRSFQIILITESGDLLTYPNNLILQKGVTMVSASDSYKQEHPELLEAENKNLTTTHD